MSNKKKVAHWKKDTTVCVFIYIVPFRPAFWGSKKTKQEEKNYSHERKSKCMSMRCHRASLFVEQSVFLPGRPKK